MGGRSRPRSPLARRQLLRLPLALAAPLGAAAALGSAAPVRLTDMPTGDLPGWRQIFADDFRTPVKRGSFPGPKYRSRWSGYSGFHDTSGHGFYEPSKVLSVADGLLNFHLHSEDGVHLVAAPVPLFDGEWNGQIYGRYSVRFRADPLEGYKVAFLLWPSDNDWSEGEVDFPEGDLDGTFYGASRRARLGSTVRFDGTGRLGAFDAWHVATIEWIPGRISWYLDGARVGSTTTNVPSTSMRWTLQAETAIGEKAPADSVAGVVQVDWVTAYRYVPSAR